MSTDLAPAPALERNWWLRALAVLVAPRAVFASLRDESDEAAEQRQDPLTAIAALAGISVVLVSPTFRRMLNDGSVSLVLIPVLAFNRAATTLSGGEAQRIRLATQIGSQLVGVLYILDEPSIGLHQRDNARLIDTLERLRDIGNTVIVVEHDEEMMRRADWLVDMGPAAGVHGGEVVAEGPATKVERNRKSVTGQFLSGRRAIAIPRAARRGPRHVHRARRAQHNLKASTSSSRSASSSASPASRARASRRS